MEQKLRHLKIATFVVTFLILIGMVVGWDIMLVRPIVAKTVAASSDFDTQKTNADELYQAIRNEKQARDNLALVQDELNFVRQRYRTLKVDLTTDDSRELTWRGWMTEYSSGFGRALREELVDAANDSLVTLSTKTSVGDPPQKPEDVKEPTSGFLKPTGGPLDVTIVSTSGLQNILDFLNRVNAGRILLTVGNIKLSGYAPKITATFQVTPYLIADIPTADLNGTPSAASTAAGAVAGAVATAATTATGGGAAASQ